MNFTKTMFALAVGSVGIMSSMSAYAVPLDPGATLTINAGAQATSVGGSPTAFATGSWFGMDTGKPIGTIGMSEQVLLAQGTTGITIGKVTAPGAFYNGTVGSTTGEVVSSWQFNGSTGTNYFKIGATPVNTAGVTTGINMSGWNVAWNTSPAIDMGSGVWGTASGAPNNCTAVGMPCSGYTSGVAVFNWNGVYGSTYTLDYLAKVPLSDPGFGGTQYALHLAGTVLAPIPEASTYGMMLAGLGLVGFAVRRRNHA